MNILDKIIEEVRLLDLHRQADRKAKEYIYTHSKEAEKELIALHLKIEEIVRGEK